MTSVFALGQSIGATISPPLAPPAQLGQSDAANVSSAQPYITYLLENLRPLCCTTQTTLVANKCDATPAPDGYMGTSALLGTGIEALRDRILQSKLDSPA